MEKFTVLTGNAAFLPRPNINTDVLIRVERMINLPKGQLGPYCFEAWRYLPDGKDDPEFPLNQPAMRDAKILVAGPNFGCGSSREPAVYALWDMGFRCLIAPSFGDILFANCFQNGMLPIILPEAVIARLQPPSLEKPFSLTVDLVRQVIATPDGQEIAFRIDAAKRRALLEGLDEIRMTLAMSGEIAKFQQRDATRRPWIYRAPNS